MKWRSAVVTAVWVCAFAGAGGLGAWSLANADMGVRNSRAEPLDDDGVRQKLAAASASAQPPGSGSGSAEPSGSGSGSGSSEPGSGASESGAPGSAARVGTVQVTGGSATAECRPDGTVYLTVWSPASGYHMDSVKRGPSDVATIEFEPLDDGDDLTYAVRCDDGRPRAVPIADHDIDHDDDDDDD